jgi:hypothetical protein
MVQTFLKPIGNGTEYEITSINEENERIVHSEGRLFFHREQAEITLPEADAAVSIKALKEQLKTSHDGSYCYELFNKFGFYYGSSFQPIQELHHNDVCALAKLSLAEHLRADFDEYILHPSLIDGALQAVVCLSGGEKIEDPYLPFALDEIEILRPISHTCYAYVELANTEQKSHPGMKKFNIKILSESGAILVKMNNFYVRALGKNQSVKQDVLDYDIES